MHTLIPALEEFASDLQAASALKAAKERIQKAEANIEKAKLKFACEPLCEALDSASRRLDVRFTPPSCLLYHCMSGVLVSELTSIL